GSVGNVTHNNGEDTSHGVWGHRHELRSHDRGVPAQVVNDLRQEQTKGVKAHVSAHVDDHAQPHLPILKCVPKIGTLELFVLGRGLLVGLEAADDADAVVGGEKLGFVGEVVDVV